MALAAAAIVARECRAPQEAFSACAVLLHAALGCFLAQAIENSVFVLIRESMRRVAENHRIALSAARVHVPLILGECMSPENSGFTGCAKILIAAQPASRVQLPESFASQLRELAGSSSHRVMA